MVHAPHTKFHVVNTVLETGYDGNLAKGQFAVVKNKAAKGKGKEVISNFDGLTSKDLISFEIGEASYPTGLRILEVPYKATGFFPIGSITDIKAYAPTNVQLTVDHLEVGFDGINVKTALFIPEGKAAVMDIVVTGTVASMFFGRPEYEIQKRVRREVGESMQAVVRRLVKELNEELVPTATGWASTTDTLSKFLEIGVVDSTASKVSGVDSMFSTLTLVDAGDSNDLADIQAQYPAYKIVRTLRDSGTSVYTIVKPVVTAVASYVKTNIDVDAKNCENCLAGYTEVAGGFVYHMTIEDDGIDLTSTVAALFTGETGLVKFGNKDGKGTYSLILPAVLTQAQYNAVLAVRPEAELTSLGDVKKVCSKTTTATTAWVDGKVCTATLRDFSITLKDTNCGESRLPELQKVFSDLVVVEGAFTGVSAQGITLSGTTGNAVLAIAGTNYSIPFTTDLTTTATAFVTSYAASILTATGATVTSIGAIINISAPSYTFPSVAGVAGGLVETVGLLTPVVVAKAGGCKRVYSTKVLTNIVCDQCDKIYLQPFYAEAPIDFQGVIWEAREGAFNSSALMGIFVKGKPFYLTPEAYEEDFVPFMETSLKVRSISFGYREEDNLNYTGAFYKAGLEFAEGRHLTFAKDVNNLSQSYFGAEDEGNLFGTNKSKHKANLFSRANLSQERQLKYGKRMLKYIVYTQDTSLSQGGAGRSDISHGFGILIEEGKQTVLELILNKLAAKVGLPAVNASAT